MSDDEMDYGMSEDEEEEEEEADIENQYYNAKGPLSRAFCTSIDVFLEAQSFLPLLRPAR